MDSKVILGIAGIVVLGVGAYSFSNMDAKQMNDDKEAMTVEVNEQKDIESEVAIESSEMKKMENESSIEPMMKKDGEDESDMSKKSDEMMVKDMDKVSGSYELYSEDKLVLADNGKVILFFKASWCPSCRTLDTDIKANLNNIPSGVTILEVDYDKSVELKQKYGVTTQHTLVQVDSAGNQLMKWSGGATLASVIEKIK